MKLRSMGKLENIYYHYIVLNKTYDDIEFELGVSRPTVARAIKFFRRYVKHDEHDANALVYFYKDELNQLKQIQAEIYEKKGNKGKLWVKDWLAVTDRIHAAQDRIAELLNLIRRHNITLNQENKLIFQDIKIDGRRDPLELAKDIDSRLSQNLGG